MSFIDPFLQSGMSDPLVSQESEFLWGNIASWQLAPIVLDKSATDPTNPATTTTLRRGLVLGQIAATGKYKQYDPTALDGSQFAKGFLYMPRNLLTPITAVLADRQADLVFAGNVKVSQLFGFDEQARVLLSGQCIFDDLRMLTDMPLTTFAPVGSSYQVLMTDNRKFLTTRNATSPFTFTLPATLSRGFYARFLNEGGVQMSVVAPAGQLVVQGGTGSNTSLTFQTANQLIGSVVEISVNDNQTKYLASLLTTNTATIV